MSNRSQGCRLEGPLFTVGRCGLFVFEMPGIPLLNSNITLEVHLQLASSEINYWM